MIGLLVATALVAGSATPVCYDGHLGEGARRRRVVVEVSAPDSATVHLYARPSRTLVLKAGAPPAPGSMGGGFLSDGSGTTVALQADSAELVTTGAKATLSRREAPSGVDVDGTWSTAIGPGGVIRLIVRISRGPCGLPVGWLDSPDQGQKDLPATAVLVSGETLVVEASYLNLRIELPARGSDERRGEMTQHGGASEILLRRGAAAPSLRRPQEPVRPFPYVEREVRFSSRSAGIRLGGALTLPPTGAPHPAIVLISGSGAQDRDETIAGHRPFLVLADHLTRLGYAVLRTDDRGVGASAGSVMKSGLHDIADDVRGAVDYLRTMPEIDHDRIGLLGHSEGGYVAPIVAAEDPRIAFVVLLVTPAVGGRDVLLAQRAALTGASDTPPLEAKVDAMMLGRIFEVLDRRPADVELESAVQSALDQWLKDLPPAERAAAGAILSRRTAAQDQSSVELWKSAWFKSLYHHDPARYLRTLQVPVFALLGELDLQVTAAQSAPVFETLFAGRRRRLLTLHRVPRLNHMLQTAVSGRMDEYMTIEETVSPDALRALADWLASNAFVRPNQ